MKKNFINKNEVVDTFILFSFVILAIFSIYFIDRNIRIKPKYISLPEEIQLAEKDDLLFVEKVTNDTIYLGFYHITDYDYENKSSNNK